MGESADEAPDRRDDPTRSDWRNRGVRVVPADGLDDRTPQTSGMQRAAAVGARTGATGLWAGAVTIAPNARTGAHHHGDLESVI